MSRSSKRLNLAQEQDFDLGALRVRPSACSVLVDGIEVRAEALTMSVLIILVRAAGATVSREELVNACWQGRIVSDDAVGRTIAKVRALARATPLAPFTLDTVPKVGYRLRMTGAPNVSQTRTESTPPTEQPLHAKRTWGSFVALAAGAVTAVLVAFLALRPGHSSNPPWTGASIPSSPQVADALLNLDEQRLHLYLQRGWSPNWLLDSEGNAALHTLMLVCERNPTHDQARLVRVARLLVAAHASVFAANGWGDTPLRIASARRYCGPNHPVVTFLRSVSAERVVIRDVPTAVDTGGQ